MAEKSGTQSLVRCILPNTYDSPHGIYHLSPLDYALFRWRAGGGKVVDGGHVVNRLWMKGRLREGGGSTQAEAGRWRAGGGQMAGSLPVGR